VVGPTGVEDSTIVLTIGHFARSIEEFIALLREDRVRLLVDVRTIPRRHNPEFNQDALPESSNRRFANWPNTSTGLSLPASASPLPAHASLHLNDRFHLRMKRTRVGETA
jgi:hypothetical protein